MHACCEFLPRLLLTAKSSRASRVVIKFGEKTEMVRSESFHIFFKKKEMEGFLPMLVWLYVDFYRWGVFRKIGYSADCRIVGEGVDVYPCWTSENVLHNMYVE